MLFIRYDYTKLWSDNCYIYSDGRKKSIAFNIKTSKAVEENMEEKKARDLVRQYQQRRKLSGAAADILGIRRAPGDNLKIIRLLNSSDPAIRSGAIKNLAQMRGSDAISAISNCLKDPDAQVRIEACKALGKMRAHPARQKLYDAVNDSNPLVCCAAAEALGFMGDKFGLPHIVKILRKKSPHQLDALKSLNIITRNKFSISARGVKEAIRWIKLTKRYLI